MSVNPTLAKRRLPLASPEVQMNHLNGVKIPQKFEGYLQGSGLFPLKATGIQIFQINLGKRCNQTCSHCHVDAGPDRKEVMPRDIVDLCLETLEKSQIPVFDITGGAPEMHPDFRYIIERAGKLGRKVIDRCNLTLLKLPNYADIPELLAKYKVEVTASLPYYQAKQTDSQRGEGVFDDSVHVLKTFNDLGYGKEGTGLVLNLVTNPVGAFLPHKQAALEKEWKREMQRRFGIVFNGLFTITNMPISRYLEYLLNSGNLEMYMDKLVQAYNPVAAAGVMCRNTLSVSWDGGLYDCDFNQMLEMPLDAKYPQHLKDFQQAILDNREIVVGPHCFGCTAGSGSSCGGATA
jgi:radical SAM/Cys-rich protein